jgi:disulfide bond formation protein DsbB
MPYHRGIHIENVLIDQVLGSFWYLEPIIGIILLIGLRKRKEKYLGLLFLLIWIFALGLDIYQYGK